MKHLSLLIKSAAGLCNLKCRYCFYVHSAAERDDKQCIMTKETVDNLIKKAVDFAECSITFAFQGGEPCFAGIEYFEYFIVKVKELNTKKLTINYAIQTNGILLDERWARFFFDNKFLVGISLDGTAEIHDDNRGQGTHKKVLKAAKLLEKYKVDFNILCVVTAKTASHILQIYNFFKLQNFRFLQFIPCLDNGKKEIFSLDDEKYYLFLSKLFEAWYRDLEQGNYFSIRQFDNYVNMLNGNPPENCAMGGKCGIYFVIESDGSVFPCDFYCTPSYQLGNININSFEELLKCNEMEVFQINTITEKCMTCKHFYLCRGGCKREKENLHYRFCNASFKFFENFSERLKNIALKC